MELTKTNVEKVLEEVRPSLIAHGGNVELVKVKEKQGIIELKLTGACAGCPYSSMTLKAGIEKALKEKITGIKEVKAVG